MRNSGALFVLALLFLPLHTQADTGWYPLPSGTTSSLRSAFFLDSSRGWAAGSLNTVLETTDGGDHWTPFAVTGSFYDVFFTTPTTGFLTGRQGPDGVILRTTDGGSTWQLVCSHAGIEGWETASFNAIQMDAAGVGHAVGTYSIDTGPLYAILAKTTNGGTTWTVHTTFDISGLQSVHFVNADVGWAMGGWFSDGFLKTTDGGATWQPFELPSGLWALSASFVDETLGFAAGTAMNGQWQDALVVRTEDGGDSWQTVLTIPGGNRLYEALYGVTFVDRWRGFVVGGHADFNAGSDITGTIFKTANGGDSWTAQESNATSQLVDVFFTDESTGWAVGNSGQIVKTTTGGSVTGIDPVPVAGARLLNNHPNPFNPSTTIRFVLPSRAHVRIDIYDTSGRRVRTLVDGARPAGPGGAVWDGRNESQGVVASGVYLYRLLVDGHPIDTKKMVLVK